MLFKKVKIQSVLIKEKTVNLILVQLQVDLKVIFQLISMINRMNIILTHKYNVIQLQQNTKEKRTNKEALEDMTVKKY